MTTPQNDNSQSLILRHLGGEEKTVTVVDIAYRRVGLSIHWGMPLTLGYYILELKTNQVMKARMWGAKDPTVAWEIWRIRSGRKYGGVMKAGQKLKCVACEGTGFLYGKPCLLCTEKKVG